MKGQSMTVPDDNLTLLQEVCDMGAKVLVEELSECPVLPTQRIAAVFRAAIESYLIFSGHAPRPVPEGNPSRN